MGVSFGVFARAQILLWSLPRPDDEVSFWRHDDHVALRPTHQRPPLRGRFARARLVDILEAERGADRARER